MKPRQPANLPASVRARLQNLSRTRKTEFQQVLSEFAIERFLYRLGASRHADRFVLKGATLFKLWTDDRHRATWDVDFLGSGASGVEDVAGVVRDVCSIAAEDGIEYDLGSIAGEPIRAAEEYGGVRVRLEARLAEARIPMQIDVGFGDAVIPSPSRQTYPTLLDHDAPRILVYPREAVVAEKLEALVSLGVTTSRMKDFYDVYVLASSFAFEGTALVGAVRATFGRRGTSLPDGAPLALQRAFLADPDRRKQWRAFLRRARLDGPEDSGNVADALLRFLEPVLAAAAGAGPFDQRWEPSDGPWLSATKEPAQ